MTGESFIDLCELEEIPLQGSRRINLSTMKIAVFRTQDNDVYAIEDKCPHLGGPLSEGIVHDGCVTCPLHNLVIDLKSGRALEEDGGDVVCFPIQIQGARVLIDLSAVETQAA